jgi:hypothetical protein
LHIPSRREEIANYVYKRGKHGFEIEKLNRRIFAFGLNGECGAALEFNLGDWRWDDIGPIGLCARR